MIVIIRVKLTTFWQRVVFLLADVNFQCFFPLQGGGDQGESLLQADNAFPPADTPTFPGPFSGRPLGS